MDRNTPRIIAKLVHGRVKTLICALFTAAEGLTPATISRMFVLPLCLR